MRRAAADIRESDADVRGAAADMREFPADLRGRRHCMMAAAI